MLAELCKLVYKRVYGPWKLATDWNSANHLFAKKPLRKQSRNVLENYWKLQQTFYGKFSGYSKQSHMTQSSTLPD